MKLRALVAAALAVLSFLVVGAPLALAAEGTPHRGGGEASLVLPDLGSVAFLGVSGDRLLLGGFVVCIAGMVFGLIIYQQLRKLPVHKAMQEISELIYETCKTYLITQGKFILILEAFIAVIIVLYFGLLLGFEPLRVIIILAFS